MRSARVPKVWSVGILAKVHAEVVTAQFHSAISIIKRNRAELGQELS